MTMSMISSVAAASRAEYPIKRDMGSPSVDHSVRPGYVASMRAALCMLLDQEPGRQRRSRW
jgi:hypothetical protein